MIENAVFNIPLIGELMRIGNSKVIVSYISDCEYQII